MIQTEYFKPCLCTSQNIDTTGFAAKMIRGYTYFNCCCYCVTASSLQRFISGPLPDYLIMMLNRVNMENGKVCKNNSEFDFPEEIFLDRYGPRHFI